MKREREKKKRYKRKKRRDKIAGNFKDFNHKYILLPVHFREMTESKMWHETGRQTDLLWYLFRKKKREREKENVVHCWRFPSRGTVMYINIHIAYIHYIHTHVHTYMHTYIKHIYFSGYKERKRKKWENKKKNNCKYVSDLVDAIKIYYKSIMHGHQGVD